MDVIQEEFDESSSRAESLQASARLVSSRDMNATPRSRRSGSFILNSLKELRKPRVPKHKGQEEGKMFGVEAKKFFGFNDGMKEEAFRQQQRAIDQEKKKDAFKNQIVQEIAKLKEVKHLNQNVEKITFTKPKNTFLNAKKVPIIDIRDARQNYVDPVEDDSLTFLKFIAKQAGVNVDGKKENQVKVLRKPNRK